MLNKKYILLDIMHIKNFGDLILNLILTLCGGLLGYIQLIVIKEENIFMCIGFVVFLDWVFGTIRALFIDENFLTKKALKLVWYLGAYSLIAFTVLTIELAHPSAFWLSEAIILPLMIFQLISAVKNAALCGIIKQETLLRILSNVDKYKEVDK